MNLESFLSSYQQQIGLYDKQSWESTVEQRILQGLSYPPRKTAKLKTELIDVDLVRGSTFPKAKPQSTLWLAGLQGIFRIFLFPMHYKWWIQETSLGGSILVAIAYCSVILSCAIFCYFYQTSSVKGIPLSEVFLPIALLILLSTIHSQITSTKRSSISFTIKGRSSRRKVKSYNRKLGVRRGSRNYDCSRKESLISDPAKVLKTSGFCRTQSENPYHKKTSNERKRSLSENDVNYPSNGTDYQISPESLTNTSPFSYQSKMFQNVDVLSNKTNSSMEYLLRYRGPTRESDSDIDSKIIDTGWKRSDSSCQHWKGTTDTADENAETPPSDIDDYPDKKQMKRKLFSVQKKVPLIVVSSNGSNSSCESEEVDDVHFSHFRKQQSSLNNWFEASSKAPSCSSDSEGVTDDFVESDHSLIHVEPLDWHIQGSPAAIIQSSTQSTEKVSCKIWEGSEMKKVDLSVLDIASLVIRKVDTKIHKSHYLTFGIVMAAVIACVPSLYRFLTVSEHLRIDHVAESSVNSTFLPGVFDVLFGNNVWCLILVLLNAGNRFVLGSCAFFLLSVAERIFKQRFLYAKHFCYLTSARRSRKYDLPHFRLNKVINIKAWLSIRSCLKKRGPQHSLDVIVSATFCATLILVCYLCVELLKEEQNVLPLLNCELFMWCFAVSIYLIRFMTLGALVNKKYSNPSILITEQINMYLHMEQKPEKKEDLMLANNVLKLVSVLLKELETPFKISGLSANPLLYNVTKFVILSACSAVLSDFFGFKLKLHRIKFR